MAALLTTRRRVALAGALALGIATAAHGAGLEELHAFLVGARTGSATFRQIVAPRGGGALQISTGTFTFERPGRFRWVYQQPYEQLIVGDGSKLWIYDRDLNQVIVRTLDVALGGSPAALLAGDNALEEHFTLRDAGSRDGLAYVDARPKTSDTGFEDVRIGFRDNLPRQMDLTDAFGNVTTLEFGMFERNRPVDPGLFRFVPPKGADVVGE
jgi:outer membrane lipoprotein carrier protein